MNELQSVTDIDEVIKYAEREAEGCHQIASAYHTDEGVYLQEETRFQYKAILWENIHEWLEELKELRKKQRPRGEWIPCNSTRTGQITNIDYKCSKCSHHKDRPVPYCEICGSIMKRREAVKRNEVD